MTDFFSLCPQLLLITPLFSALILFLWPKATLLRRYVATLFFLQPLLLSFAALFFAYQGEISVTLAGGWSPPYGIVLVLDQLSAIMILSVNIVFISTVLYGFFSEPLSSEHVTKLPFLFFLQTGVMLTLLTGDFFNLFVAIEIMLCSSYALMAVTCEKSKLSHAFSYVILSMTASFLFLVLAGSFYGYTGHLNMAAISEFLETKGEEPFLIAMGLLTLVIFGLKAGVFPLYFWLPDSYPILPASLAGLYGGILTKVGVYILIRLFITVLPHDLTMVYTIAAFLAGFTMLFGVLGAVGKNTMKGILSYHILSQTGYMIFAIAMFTPLAIAAGIFFIVHNIFVKSSLFLLSGLGKIVYRSDSLDKVSGLWEAAPIGGFLFLIQAMSLAGIPPFSGFWGKYLLFAEGLRVGHWILVGIAAVTSFFTLFSMIKIWTHAYMGSSKPETSFRQGGVLFSSFILVLCSLYLAFGAQSAFTLTEKASEQIFHPKRYLEAVLQSKGKGGNI